VLVVWIALPVGLFYLWGGVLQPLLFGTYQGDFQESYMRAAGRIAAGLDPTTSVKPPAAWSRPVLSRSGRAYSIDDLTL